MFNKYFNNENITEKEEDDVEDEIVVEDEVRYENEVGNNDEDEIVNEEDKDEIVNEEDEDEISDEEVKLNYYDEDEDKEDKLYIISIDNIPHLYGKSLKDLRSKMWDIANVLLKSKNEYDGYYIFTNNLNEIKIICPYEFFILKYHHVLYELKIDYVLDYKLYVKKDAF
jgi:hypothetical protein